MWTYTIDEIRRLQFVNETVVEEGNLKLKIFKQRRFWINKFDDVMVSDEPTRFRPAKRERHFVLQKLRKAEKNDIDYIYARLKTVKYTFVEYEGRDHYLKRETIDSIYYPIDIYPNGKTNLSAQLIPIKQTRWYVKNSANYGTLDKKIDRASKEDKLIIVRYDDRDIKHCVPLVGEKCIPVSELIESVAV